MLESEHENIWKLLNDYKLKVDPDTINDDMTCIICKDLMVDACRSICGCQYCRKCINEYIGDRNTFCPGDRTTCKEEYLSLDKDVVSDRRMNNKILKSKVLCPNESCKAKIELSQMHEHLRVCMKQLTECPFITIGCDNGEQTKDSILIHFTKETLPHAQLLLDYVRNLKNDVDALQSNFVINKAEIVSLKEDLTMKDNKMEEMTKSNREIELRVMNLKKEMDSMKEDSKRKDKQIREMVQQLNKQEKETNENVTKLKIEGKREREESVKRIATLEGRLKAVSNGMEAGISPMMKEMTINRETENGINEQKKNTKKVVQPTTIGIEVTNNWIDLCQNIDVDFIWKIDEWKKKKKTMLNNRFYSDPFYSQRYKLCLSLLIRPHDIWLCCAIMKGENDDELMWPMRHKVTLSIINQHTLKAHKSVMLQYDTCTFDKDAFDKPTSDMNRHDIGTKDVVEYPTLKNNPSIIVKDTAIVSCIVTD